MDGAGLLGRWLEVECEFVARLYESEIWIGKTQ
jgi:hypothetical protein